MAGTREGGLKARDTVYKTMGNDFYKIIGKKGGENGHTGGFASEKIGKDGLTGAQRSVIAGRKGGLISRRGKSLKHFATNPEDENLQTI